MPRGVGVGKFDLPRDWPCYLHLSGVSLVLIHKRGGVSNVERSEEL